MDSLAYFINLLFQDPSILIAIWGCVEAGEAALSNNEIKKKKLLLLFSLGLFLMALLIFFISKYNFERLDNYQMLIFLFVFFAVIFFAGVMEKKYMIIEKLTVKKCLKLKFILNVIRIFCILSLSVLILSK